jgi:hypothetical protein
MFPGTEGEPIIAFALNVFGIKPMPLPSGKVSTIFV